MAMQALGEGPSNQAARAFRLALRSRDNVKTTLRAFTAEEFAEMVKKLP
jgi:uncharacterized protein with GYD domain